MLRDPFYQEPFEETEQPTTEQLCENIIDRTEYFLTQYPSSPAGQSRLWISIIRFYEEVKRWKCIEGNKLRALQHIQETLEAMYGVKY